VELDGDPHTLADPFADRSQRGEPLLQLRRAEVLAAGCPGERIEGPDLHALDPRRQQLLGQSTGVVVEAPEVRNGLGADTGVVDGDGRPRSPAEELIDGQAGHLPQDVPQGDVDGRQGAQLAPGRTDHPQGVVHRRPQPVDPAGVGPDQKAARQVVHDHLGGLGVVSNFAEALQAVVGREVQPHEAGIRGVAQRFQARDLHRQHGTLPAP
jgi:hypothetical protein